MSDPQPKAKAKTITAEILEECLRIHAERDDQYGSSETEYTEVAKIATALSLDGIEYTAEDALIIMISTKAYRYKHQYYLLQDNSPLFSSKVMRDSLIDWINYIAILENVLIKNANRDV